MKNDNRNLDANRDPIIGAPGAHPVGTGLGALAGGAAAGGQGRYPGRDFDDVESEMAGDWATGRGASSLSWGRARPVARDAWNRISPSN